MFVKHKVNAWHMAGGQNILLLIMAVFQEFDSMAD